MDINIYFFSIRFRNLPNVFVSLTTASGFHGRMPHKAGQNVLASPSAAGTAVRIAHRTAAACRRPCIRMPGMAIFEIGFIPPGPFQLKSRCSQLFFEALFTARRTNRQGLVRQFLQNILGKTAFFTTISINWHFELRKLP